jgi:hypothetical protein
LHFEEGMACGRGFVASDVRSEVQRPDSEIGPACSRETSEFETEPPLASKHMDESAASYRMLDSQMISSSFYFLISGRFHTLYTSHLTKSGDFIIFTIRCRAWLAYLLSYLLSYLRTYLLFNQVLSLYRHNCLRNFVISGSVACQLAPTR